MAVILAVYEVASSILYLLCCILKIVQGFYPSFEYGFNINPFCILAFLYMRLFEFPSHTEINELCL